MRRDAKTPAEQVKQILQIHAVLPGQTPDRKFNIPSRSNSYQVSNSQNHDQSTRTSQSPQTEKPSEVANLIDLDDAPAVTTPAATPKKKDNMLRSMEALKIEESTTSHGSANLMDLEPSNPSNQPVLPLHKPKSLPDSVSPEAKEKIAKELPPSKLLHSNPKAESQDSDALRRLDTETQEEDEFHDAQS